MEKPYIHKYAYMHNVYVVRVKVNLLKCWRAIVIILEKDAVSTQLSVCVWFYM